MDNRMDGTESKIMFRYLKIHLNIPLFEFDNIVLTLNFNLDVKYHFSVN